jgi:hypothetical protein
MARFNLKIARSARPARFGVMYFARETECQIEIGLITFECHAVE